MAEHPFDRQPCTLCPGGVCVFAAPERDPAYVPGTPEYLAGLRAAQLVGPDEYPAPAPAAGGPASGVWYGTHAVVADQATAGGRVS